MIALRLWTEPPQTRALDIDKSTIEIVTELLNITQIPVPSRHAFHHAQCDYESAEEMYRRALEIGEHLGRQDVVATSCGNIGHVLKARGDLDGAEQMYRKSLEIDERMGRLEGLVNDYSYLGSLFRARGENEKAAQMYRKALDHSQRLGASRLIKYARTALDELSAKPSVT